MINKIITPQASHCLPVESIINRPKGSKHFFKPKASVLSLRSAIISVLLSSISIPAFAAGYALNEIPFPDPVKNRIPVPAGATIRPVCLSINDNGQVACNLEIIEKLVRTPVDRLAPSPKIFASYAYVWNSRQVGAQPILLSTIAPNTFDQVHKINSGGVVGGSTSVVGKRSQAAIWNSLSTAPTAPKLFGPGVIKDINNRSDYVLNDQLFLFGANLPVNFEGRNIAVHAVNNTLTEQAAGKQSLITPVKIAGIGLLYSSELLQPVVQNPLYALTSSLASYSVSSLNDNGKFVITGTANTISANVALSCRAINKCLTYTSTVGTSGRGVQYIRLNSINNAGHVVGTDGGVAELFLPPTPISPNGKVVDLNGQLPAGSFSRLGWFLNEATSINNSGQIVTIGQKAGNLVAGLLTPI